MRLSSEELEERGSKKTHWEDGGENTNSGALQKEDTVSSNCVLP